MQATECTLLPEHSTQCLFSNYTEEKKEFNTKKIKKERHCLSKNCRCSTT